MLEIKNIKKNFGKLAALDNVNLNIKSGEFFGILGPNGAGKTTLMNIIIGYLSCHEGKVTLHDEEITTDNISIRKKFGYVPQDISLYQELSAEKNLKIFGELYNLTGSELSERIGEVMELVQLSERSKDKVKTFSGGMKRRLNLAVSLLHKPEILLCDEPTVGVDPQSRNAIFNMLADINKKGTTVIYTTHYMEEAERLCSRIAIIDAGKIIAEGKLHELIALLDQQQTIKIRKTADTSEVISQLEKYGKVLEEDYTYELMLNESYKLDSNLILTIEQTGIPLANIEISGASLEDVFLTMTGRSLRD